MNNLDKQYQNLVKEILLSGTIKKDRTGTGTQSLFGKQIRHNMKEGFPLLTTKKMAWKTMVTELLWFLRGETNIEYLLENNCHIWDGDCYKKYLQEDKASFDRWTSHSPENMAGSVWTPYTKERFLELIMTDKDFREKHGDLGPIYGKQWRNWESIKPSSSNQEEDPSDGKCYWTRRDQIGYLLNQLETNPDSRRMIVNSWNLSDLDEMTLPPCHYSFQLYTTEMTTEERNEYFFSVLCGGNPEFRREWKDFELDQQNIPSRRISLSWNQRSVDVGLGLPFNIASYGLLLSIIAREVNMVPDELIGNLGDCHIYLNQIEAIKNQLYRESFELPKLKILHNLEDPSILLKPKYWKPEDFIIDGYQSHPSIKMPLSNG